MAKFVCDNKEIENALLKLHAQIVANGGAVHEKLIISCIKGDLQIMIASDVPDGEEIIVLPKECLLPVDKFKLDLEGCKIVMLSHHRDMSELQVSMMKTMIELFNLTGKMEAQKEVSTFSLQFEDKDLMQRILKSRSENGIPFLKEREGMSKKSYYLKNFLMTRTLDVKEVGSAAVSTKVLMPIIDCLNHHAKANRFTPKFEEVSSSGITQENKVTHIVVLKSCSVEGSEECYVKYGPYDSMDALIQYNYVDSSAFFVRSVPVKIDLPDEVGVIDIRSMTWDSQHKDLPDNLKNLELYIPAITTNIVKDVVTLSFLYIPSSSSPHAMRRVLALALSRLELNLEQRQMVEILQFVEKRIIKENIKYFEELSEYLKSYKPRSAVRLIVDNSRDVVATQLNHVKSYDLLA